MSKFIGFVVLLVAAGSALAGGDHNHFFNPPWQWPVKAPELDPASAVAGLTMLAGTLAVIRGRRAKNKSDKSEKQ
jgi:hypothetical protein